MPEFVTKRRFDNPLLNGFMLFLFMIIYASIAWIIFSQFFNLIITLIAGSALDALPHEISHKYREVFVEGAFFWLAITPWIWMALNLGNPNKYDKGYKQPMVGIIYVGKAFLWGLIGFLFSCLLLGIFWKPFNLAYIFNPQTEEQAMIAIKGLTASNFFALASILGQILSVSLFGKWPAQLFTNEPKAINFINWSLSLALAILIWAAIMIPGFLDPLAFNGIEITANPWGSWVGTNAWFQAFIFLFLMPAEGFAGYPQRLVTRKQPWSGLVGLAIAIGGAFLLRGAANVLLGGIAEASGLALDVVVAAFFLSWINVMLTWHQYFEDYPSLEQAGGNEGKRILTQLAIVLVLGTIWGLAWPFVYKYLPIAGNDLGLGHPVLGPVAGQFVYMVPMLYSATGFDRWPINQNVPKV
ncbi:hypothetical protein [Eremococcus coleocola]|uniref:Uncharacterized protein n=1 Tax=Eremococcus coleocola ACS-139-V-Col8 TaxID=908337 RepID=E4KR69_9LACT|nr:hypothetical protein [Eremococcus coleocola]EFR30498.1 hypothetical protein HMPREF9257_0368 [Eremococcus coleocola ACS-139-V-Col8]